MKGARIPCILLGDELEFDGAASRLNLDGRETGSAEEYPRADWLAIDHQSWRAGTGLDANREALGARRWGVDRKARRYGQRRKKPPPRS